MVNWLFGLVFLGSRLIGERTVVERMMRHAVELPRRIWNRLNLAWSLFFIASGALNLYVAFNFTEETWVNFKLFGMLGLTAAFVVLQAFYMARHIQDQPSTQEES